MSANAFEEDRKHSMDAGMNGHLSKPIEAADVRACLVQELEGRRAWPRAAGLQESVRLRSPFFH